MLQLILSILGMFILFVVVLQASFIFVEGLQEDCNEYLFGDQFNVTVPEPFHQNVTILEKEHRNRNMRGDVFNVIYKTESGDIQVDNNRTLYYLVEEGESYNVIGQYAIRDIIKE